MKTRVVFESMFGNAEQVAHAIAESPVQGADPAAAPERTSR